MNKPKITIMDMPNVELEKKIESLNRNNKNIYCKLSIAFERKMYFGYINSGVFSLEDFQNKDFIELLKNDIDRMFIKLEENYCVLIEFYYLMDDIRIIDDCSLNLGSKKYRISYGFKENKGMIVDESADIIAEFDL